MIEAKTKGRGGKRAGAGRPSQDLVRKSVFLTPQAIATLRELGKGNLSLGCRLAAAAVAQNGRG